MEMETALNAGFLGFGRLVAAVARIDVPFENDFAVSDGIGIDSAGFTNLTGDPWIAPAMPISSQPWGRIT